jgi:hypothetical protein
MITALTGGIPSPPGNARFVHTFRYFDGANAYIEVKRSDLLNQWVMIATSTSGYPILQSVKILSVDLYVSPPVSATSYQASAWEFNWTGIYAGLKSYAGAITGSSGWSHGHFKPQKMTSASFPCTLGSGSTTLGEILFTYYSPSPQTIVDVTCECVIGGNSQYTGVGVDLTGFTTQTVGTLAQNVLDYSGSGYLGPPPYQPPT